VAGCEYPENTGKVPFFTFAINADLCSFQTGQINLTNVFLNAIHCNRLVLPEWFHQTGRHLRQTMI